MWWLLMRLLSLNVPDDKDIGLRNETWNGINYISEEFYNSDITTDFTVLHWRQDQRSQNPGQFSRSWDCRNSSIPGKCWYFSLERRGREGLTLFSLMVVGWRTRGFLAVLISRGLPVVWDRRGGVEETYSVTSASSPLTRKGSRLAQFSSGAGGLSRLKFILTQNVL